MIASKEKKKISWGVINDALRLSVSRLVRYSG